MTTISLAKLRLNLKEVIKKLVKNNERFVVEKDEIPVGVFVNYNEYKEMISELEDYRLATNPDVVARIEEAKKDIKEGRVQPFDEFVKELGL